MERPMKWYKFVIYFQLFSSALVNIISGVSFCTGLYYGGGDAATHVYAYYGSLRWIDLFMGICSFALAAMAIVVRQKLKNFKKNGPEQYLLLLILGVLIQAEYAILASLIIGEMVLNTSIIVQIATSVALIFANKKYFDNRRHLFVNQ